MKKIRNLLGFKKIIVINNQSHLNSENVDILKKALNADIVCIFINNNLKKTTIKIYYSWL